MGNDSGGGRAGEFYSSGSNVPSTPGQTHTVFAGVRGAPTIFPGHDIDGNPGTSSSMMNYNNSGGPGGYISGAYTGQGYNNDGDYGINPYTFQFAYGGEGVDSGSDYWIAGDGQGETQGGSAVSYVAGGGASIGNNGGPGGWGLVEIRWQYGSLELKDQNIKEPTPEQKKEIEDFEIYVSYIGIKIKMSLESLYPNYRLYILDPNFIQFIQDLFQEKIWEEIKNNYKSFRKWVKDGKPKFYNDEIEIYDIKIDLSQFSINSDA
jgi:hypothetical protein